MKRGLIILVCHRLNGDVDKFDSMSDASSACPLSPAEQSQSTVPLFEKEGLGEICAVNHGFTSSIKSPLIPLLLEGGKLLPTHSLSRDEGSLKFSSEISFS